MSNALRSAAVGMKTHQSQINTIANNIANLNTAGFKKSRLELKDATYSPIASSQSTNGQNQLQKGNSVLVAGQTKIFTQGNLENTGRGLDISINGQGFFAYEDSGGNQEYSRSGNLSVRNIEGVNYLVNQNGDFVLDRNGNRIRVSFPPEQIYIGSAGEVSDGQNEPVANIAVYNFENPNGLRERGEGKYLQTFASGQPVLEDLSQIEIKSGYLESSNVDIIEEMSQLIKYQRAYTFLSRAVKNSDDIKAMENNLRS